MSTPEFTIGQRVVVDWDANESHVARIIDLRHELSRRGVNELIGIRVEYERFDIGPAVLTGFDIFDRALCRGLRRAAVLTFLTGAGQGPPAGGGFDIF